MDASVTLKVTPWEFDLLRRALGHYKDHLGVLIADPATDTGRRTDARKTLLATSDVLEKLGK